VHIQIVSDGAVADYELHTGDQRRGTITHRDLRIGLVDLQPYPFSSRPVQPGDYRATLTTVR
jgi:hypothetical protein